MADHGDEAWHGAAEDPDLLLGHAPRLVDRLEQWIADARVDGAALSRSRERWLEEVAAQEATLLGTLLDLGERRTRVSVRTLAAHVYHGVVEVVGVDFVGLRTPAGSSVLLATAAISVVRPAPGEDPATGERMVATELRLADVLGELAADRERVLVVTRDGEGVAGVLRGAGRDVLALRAEGSGPTLAYVPLAAVAEVAIT